MPFSKRENELINILINSHQTLTAVELAAMTNVSTKTIYRTVKRINSSSENGDIIHSEAGKGFQINYENYLEGISMKRDNELVITPQQRRAEIILNILFKSPKSIGIDELFHKYYLSDSAIECDLSLIKHKLNANHLDVSLKNRRIKVRGSEAVIRRLINSLISSNSFGKRMEFTNHVGQLNPYDIDYISKLLDHIENELETTINYPYNSNLFSHLYILIKRMREGQIHNSTEELDDTEKELIHQQQYLYNLAKAIITKIELYANDSLPQIEVFYLFQYLVASKIEGKKGIDKIILNDKSYEISKYILESISTQLDINIVREKNVMNLMNHMDPLLYRIENHITIDNNLLRDIVVEYKEEFKLLKSVIKDVESKFDMDRLSKKITDDEVGYLVLYIVKFILLENENKRILIICSSGIGTSELLKVKVRKSFPTIEIVDVLSYRQYKKTQTKYGNIDLIVTTIKMDDPLNLPTVLVSSLFTQQDQNRIKMMLGE